MVTPAQHESDSSNLTYTITKAELSQMLQSTNVASVPPPRHGHNIAIPPSIVVGAKAYLTPHSISCPQACLRRPVAMVT